MSFPSLTEAEARHIAECKTCPDCKIGMLLPGPSAGLMINALCSNQACGHKFNLCTVALQMSHRLPDGPLIPELPIKLEWNWIEADQTYTARVPARDANGDGFVIIYAIKRPIYCDSGQWHVLVETEGVFELDGQEGFPRYYFKLNNLQEEMLHWVNARRMCKKALQPK